jgi:hypothetical protein
MLNNAGNKKPEKRIMNVIFSCMSQVNFTIAEGKLSMTIARGIHVVMAMTFFNEIANSTGFT